MLNKTEIYHKNNRKKLYDMKEIAQNVLHNTITEIEIKQMNKRLIRD